MDVAVAFCLAAWQFRGGVGCAAGSGVGGAVED